MTHPNEVAIRDLYDAFETGNEQALEAGFAPNVVWHEAGNNELAGDYKGLEEVMGFHLKMGELLDGNIKVEVHDVLANDEHAVVLENMTVGREGVTVNVKSVAIFHLEDGKVTEGWEIRENQAAIDELLS